MQTTEQRGLEAKTLIEIEKERALIRKSLGGQGGIKEDTAEPPYAGTRGEARDIVAEQVGLKSGREVESN